MLHPVQCPSHPSVFNAVSLEHHIQSIPEIYFMFWVSILILVETGNACFLLAEQEEKKKISPRVSLLKINLLLAHIVIWSCGWINNLHKSLTAVALCYLSIGLRTFYAFTVIIVQPVHCLRSKRRLLERRICQKYYYSPCEVKFWYRLYKHLETQNPFFCPGNDSSMRATFKGLLKALKVIVSKKLSNWLRTEIQAKLE